MYDILLSNIITDSRYSCGFIREDASLFLLNYRLYIEQRTVFFICYNTIILFGEILELYYLETLKTTMLKMFSYHKQYIHSLRTVGELPKEHTIPNPHSPFYLYVIIHFFISEMLIHLLSGMFSVRTMFA